ncbi:MAG: NDP-sugar synthase [Oligoflexales bacterium]
MSTLVIMAAGLGSRYKGLKQIDEVGPSGEILMDYSIGDAVRSGFKKIVIIIAEDFLPICREKMQKRWGEAAPITYAVQMKDDLPDPYTLPEGRIKPWGTGHALLAVRGKVKGNFALINADDYYGPDAFKQMAEFLDGMDKQGCNASLVGYTLSNTTSPHGSVSRGVCRLGASSIELESIVERKNIVMDVGRLFWLDDGNNRHELLGSEVVSMNFWGFNESVFEAMEDEFFKFLAENISHPKKEFLIPEAVNTLVSENILKVKVLPTSAQWFGMTYPEDKSKVKQQLLKLESPSSSTVSDMRV